MFWSGSKVGLARDGILCGRSLSILFLTPLLSELTGF